MEPDQDLRDTPLFKILCKYLALLCVAIALGGLLLFDKNFAVFRVGPFYALDFLFLVWVFFAAVAGFDFQRISSVVKDLRFVLLFFAWGSFLFLLSLLRAKGLPPYESYSRIFQHGIIFVYPLLWSIAGYWTFSLDEKFAPSLAYFVAGLAFCFNLFGILSPSLAGMGSLFVIVGLFIWRHSFSKEISTKQKSAEWLLSGLIVFFIFLPYWNMWVVHMQRTNLIALFGMILLVPILIRKPAMAFVLFGVFFAGAMTMTKLHFPTGLKDNFYAVMQHGDDVAQAESEKPFQFRTRLYLWKKAYAQWREHPFLGVGFVEEVPPMTLDDYNYIHSSHFKEIPSDLLLSGPHNSYLGMAARMGIIGLGLWLVMFFNWLRATRALWKDKPLAVGLISVFVVVNGALYALFNVGLESPHNSVAMWLFFGGTLFLVSPLKKSFLQKSV